MPYREYKTLSAQAREARELAKGEADPEMAAYFHDEAGRLDARVAELRGRLELLLVPKDPDEGKDLILEIRAGAGGEEAALWAGTSSRCIGGSPIATGGRRTSSRPRRADLGGFKEVSLEVRGNGCVRPAQVRGRGPPCPAGPGHRVAGQDPHVDGDGGRHAGGRGGRGRPPTRGPADRRLPVERSRAASRSTPPTRRCASSTSRAGSRSRCRRNAASSRTGRRRCGTSGRGCTRWRSTRPMRRRRRPAGRSSGRGSDRRRSAPTTSREGRVTDHRIKHTSHQLQDVLAGGEELDGFVDRLLAAERAAQLAATGTDR